MARPDVGHAEVMEENARTPIEKNAHRGGLASRVRHIWPRDPGLLERIGGRERLGKVVDELYRRIGEDPLIQPMFGGAFREDRTHQKKFFEEWLGGEANYSRDVEGLGTRLYHSRFGIDRRSAGRWLHHMTKSLRLNGVPQEAVREMMQVIGPMAHSLAADNGIPLPAQVRHADRRGGAEALARALEQEPDLLERSRGDARNLLFRASRDGQLAMAEILTEHGVELNRPYPYANVLVTPWCVAEARGHTALAALLRENGAILDVFSLAFLGRVDELKEMLDDDPDLVHVDDPASDHRHTTPLHHAIYGGSHEAARLLLERGGRLPPGSAPLLERLAEEGQVDLLKVCLERGGKAAEVESGRWTLQEEAAQVLLDHGADVNRPPGRWLRFCTAHLGQTDEPDLIQALIRCGVDLTARGPDGELAVHRAAQAGHTGVLEALLGAGVPVDAEDSNGATPLAYLFWAIRRADRPATARILLAHGADPHRGDPSPLERSKKDRRKDADALREVFAAC